MATSVAATELFRVLRKAQISLGSRGFRSISRLQMIVHRSINTLIRSTQLFDPSFNLDSAFQCYFADESINELRGIIRAINLAHAVIVVFT